MCTNSKYNEINNCRGEKADKKQSKEVPNNKATKIIEQLPFWEDSILRNI